MLDNTLYVFDIDDTLFKTSAVINVLDESGKLVKSLSSREFSGYVLKDGCIFDFSEFRDPIKFKDESKPIFPVLQWVLNLQFSTKHSKVNNKLIFVTAREDFTCKLPVLEKFASCGIDMINSHIHRAGNLPSTFSISEKKNFIVSNYIDSGLFDRVIMVDDSMTNLMGLKSLQVKYPDVRFSGYNVTENEEITKIF